MNDLRLESASICRIRSNGDGWIATANVRHDIAKTTLSDDRTYAAAGSDRKYCQTTWRLGLSQEFEVGLTASATAQKVASIKLDYDVASVPGLTVSGGVRFVGSSWADNANTLKVPASTLTDAAG